MLIDRSAEIARIAAAYPPEAANVPAAEREQYFTDAQQAAWCLRFEHRDIATAPAEEA